MTSLRNLILILFLLPLEVTGASKNYLWKITKLLRGPLICVHTKEENSTRKSSAELP